MTMTNAMAGFEPLPFEVKWSATTAVLYWAFLLVMQPQLVLTPGPTAIELVSRTWPVLVVAIVAAIPVSIVLSRAYWEVSKSR